MKICRECGTASADDTVFCYICGTKFSENITTEGDLDILTDADSIQNGIRHDTKLQENNPHFNRGYESEDLVTDTQKMEAMLENPAILITDKDIVDIYDILPLLEEVAKNRRPLLIIANSFEESIINTLVVNKQHGILTCVAVKAPGFGD